MTLPDDFIFSQTSLQDYVDCARRFELRYLLDIRWPAPQATPVLEHERHMQQGERFHKLVHQHILGIPAERLTQQIHDDALMQWWRTYLVNGLKDVPEKRRPETTLSAPLGDYRLIAKYDLLAVEPGKRALIIDWKTSLRVPRKEAQARRMQTVVYRYVLALAGDTLNGGKPIPPEQIEMVYWYAANGGQQIRLPYSQAQFKQDKADLLAIVEEIKGRVDFPLTTNDNHCKFCVYRSLCDRGREAGTIDEFLEEETDYEPMLDDFAIDLDQIAEIEF